MRWKRVADSKFLAGQRLKKMSLEERVHSRDWSVIAARLAELGGLRVEEVEAATGLPAGRVIQALCYARMRSWVQRRAEDGEYTLTDSWRKLAAALRNAERELG